MIACLRRGVSVALLLSLLFVFCLGVQAQTPPAPAAPAASTPAAPAASAPAAPAAAPAAPAAAAPADKFNRGDTAWMIMATALVMLMTPGLAFFYGGLTRSKNVLNALMMSFVALGIISIQWMLFGYSIAFGEHEIKLGNWGIFASPMQFLGLHHVGVGPRLVPGSTTTAMTIPHTIYMLFQMTFAIITPALISGAIVERMKFSAYCLFILLWATFFYDPLAHMVWGGGWIGSMGALDFAGGTVVHISSGVSALTLAIILGKRKGHGSEEMRPHNVPMVLLGAALLWFGWFGFNAGSELASDGVACAAFINTHIATAAAAMSWILIEWIKFKKPTAVGFASGAVAGLVAITPACGFVNPVAALAIGLIVSPICYAAIQLKGKLNTYDDALDVFGVHACGGMWGALATGLFANSLINPAVTSPAGNGIFGGPNGSIHQFITQLIAVVATVIMAVVSTVIIAKVVGLICGGLRASADEEEHGLDVTEHGETGYSGENAGFPALSGAE